MCLKREMYIFFLAITVELCECKWRPTVDGRRRGKKLDLLVQV